MIKLGTKAASLAKLDKSAAHVAQIASADLQQHDFGDVREIAITEIRPDPTQARTLGITLDLLRNPDGISDLELQRQVESILGLAESLKTAKQRQPIEVYAHGAHFNIVAGERRWWAAQVAGMRTLWAKVLTEKPNRLRLIQYVENAQREGLSTRETLQALKQVMAESAVMGESVESFTQLKKVTGLPKASASRWWAILSGPEEVRVAVEGGQLTGLVAAERAARMTDARARAKLIEDLGRAEREGGIREVLEALERPAASGIGEKPAGKITRGRGRPKKVVLGTTSNIAVAKLILSRLTGKAADSGASEDPKTLTKAIAGAIKQLEQDLR